MLKNFQEHHFQFIQKLRIKLKKIKLTMMMIVKRGGGRENYQKIKIILNNPSFLYYLKIIIIIKLNSKFIVFCFFFF